MRGWAVRLWWLWVGHGGLADLAAADCPAAWAAVSWALEGFTAEFGMGSGGSLSAKATRSAKPCAPGRPRDGLRGGALGQVRGWGCVRDAGERPAGRDGRPSAS